MRRSITSIRARTVRRRRSGWGAGAVDGAGASAAHGGTARGDAADVVCGGAAGSDCFAGGDGGVCGAVGGSEVVVIEDSGHSVYFEQSQVFDKAVVEHLETRLA